jgi:hypothetical protein
MAAVERAAIDMSKKIKSMLNRSGRKLAQGLLTLTGNGAGYSVANKRHIAKQRDLGELPYGAMFNDAAGLVLRQGRTLMTMARLHVLWQCVRNTYGVDGAVAEIGVFRGGSSYFLALAYDKLGSKPSALHAIDTFQGHAPGTISAADSYHAEGMFADTSYEAVRDYLADFDFVRVHQGEFSTVVPKLEDSHYRLVHIDTDLYQPTLDCLAYFLPKLSAGGIFIVDDYLGKKCAGVTRAVHEFLGLHPEFDHWYFQTEQIVLVHRPVARSVSV